MFSLILCFHPLEVLGRGSGTQLQVDEFEPGRQHNATFADYRS